MSARKINVAATGEGKKGRDTKRINITLFYCFVFTSMHERWVRITLREFIRPDGEREGGGRRRMENRDEEELVRQVGDKRTRQSREGVQRGARSGEGEGYFI